MALKSLRDVNHKLVAIVGIVVLGAAVSFAFAVGQLRLLERGYEMSGEFEDTGGMKPGDDIRVAGVKAGRITSIEPDFGQGHVVMKWTVDNGIELGRQARAEVHTATLLGGRYLRLSGPVSQPYLHELDPGQRRIPLERTSVPFTVTDAIDSGSTITEAIDQRAIDKILVESAKIDTPDAHQLRRMLRNFRQLSTSLNDQAPQFEKLIANSKKVTTTLARKDEKLVRIINASKVLLEALVQRRDELVATVGRGNRTVDTLSKVISRHEKEIDGLMSNLNVVTSRIAPNMDALNASFALLGPSLRGVANVRGNGPWIEGLLAGLGPIQPNGPISTGRS